jgi:hypothetical protein
MNKFNTSPAEDRRYLGRTFGSKAEMRYAHLLEWWVSEGILHTYICQPSTWLGVPENTYKPDFLVVPVGATPHFVEVKGMETGPWKRNKKLWAKYGRLPLHIVKARGAMKFETVEVIEP